MTEELEKLATEISRLPREEREAFATRIRSGMGPGEPKRALVSRPENGNWVQSTPGYASGRPRISGTGITVQNVVIWHERMGLSADEIASEYSLPLGAVYAALAYYFDHRPEIEAGIRAEQEFVESLRPEAITLERRK